MQSSEQILAVSSSHSRKSLRSFLRNQRRSLTDAQQKSAARNLASRLWRLQCIRSANSIAAYWPVDGEIDPMPFLRQAHRRRKHTCLPVINPARSLLGFGDWNPGRTLRPNIFGIPEPGPGAAASQLESLDVILVPLVGFDALGHRLGMGGGFYDRTFAGCRSRLPLLIGVAHDFQRVEHLQTAPWDIDLDLVITDRRIYPANKRRVC